MTGGTFGGRDSVECVLVHILVTINTPDIVLPREFHGFDSGGTDPRVTSSTRNRTVSTRELKPC